MKITRKQLKTLIEHAINEAKSTTVTIEIKGIDYYVKFQRSKGNIDVMSVTQRGSSKPKCDSWYSGKMKEAVMDGLRARDEVPQRGGSYRFGYDWTDKPLFFGCEY